MSRIAGHMASKEILSQLQDIKSQMQHLSSDAKNNKSNESSTSFADHLKESVSEINNMQNVSDRMSTDLATGKTDNIHETMLAATKAELGFNLMVQVRNKVLEAYQEVMRMQI